MSRLASLVLVVLALAACKSKGASASADAVASTPMPAGSKFDKGAIAGKLLESAEGDGFTYLLLKTPSGDRWIAVPSATGLTIGQTVVVADARLVNGWQSKALGRAFESVIFGTLSRPGAFAPKSSAHAGMASASASKSAGE